MLFGLLIVALYVLLYILIYREFKSLDNLIPKAAFFKVKFFALKKFLDESLLCIDVSNHA
jgi:hypothetical protein